MSNTIHIPPAALEAGAKAVFDNWGQKWDVIARAAFVAMVVAWPNGNLHVPVGAGQPRKSFTLPALILPLPPPPAGETNDR